MKKFIMFMAICLCGVMYFELVTDKVQAKTTEVKETKKMSSLVSLSDNSMLDNISQSPSISTQKETTKAKPQKRKTTKQRSVSVKHNYSGYCCGTTKKGLSCRNRASKGSIYCWRHGG